MLAELPLELGQPAQALAAFETSHRTDPNRFHGLAGAGRAAEMAGDKTKAKDYCAKLIALAKSADTERPEIASAKKFIARSPAAQPAPR